MDIDPERAQRGILVYDVHGNQKKDVGRRPEELGSYQ